MTSAGYYRFPTIHDTVIVFVSEDDLWSTTLDGNVARRLTSNLGSTTHPSLSPDGERLAFIGREEGAEEVYVMPSIGGSARRLTYLSSRCVVLGWNATGTHILFASNYGQPVHREMALFQIAADCTNGEFESLGFGPARAVAFGAGGETVLGRNTGEPAQWKRYRGGTAGHLWVDRTGDGQFERFLADLPGNITSPMWINDTSNNEGKGPRVFFVSDHEGIGNLYSCTPDETNLQRHTDHESYYVRNPNTDGNRIVYHAGADLHVYDIATAEASKVAVSYHSPRVQRNRKFIHAGSYLDDVSLDPGGHKLAITARGKPFAFYNFDGPVLQFGRRDGVRYRLAEWLNDGRRLVMVSDEPGEEVLEVHDGDPKKERIRLDDLDLGRPISMKVSPTADKVAIANHRHELLVVDLTSGELTVADRSEYRRIAGFDWSPDGRWIAYGCSLTAQTTAIRLYRLPETSAKVGLDDESSRNEENEAINSATEDSGSNDNETDLETPQAELAGEVFTVTDPILHDVSPAFDPEGNHLYFLSHREFNPVYDGLHFDLGFPWGVRPYLVTLRSDITNPFLPRPDLESQNGASDGGDGDDSDDDGDDESENKVYAHRDATSRLGAMSRYGRDVSAGGGAEEGPGDTEAERTAVDGSSDSDLDKSDGDDADSAQEDEGPPRLQIDLDGIDRRIYAFPVPDGRYGAIAGIKGKALFTEFSLQGQLDGDDEWDDDDSESGSLRVYNFKEYRGENLIDGINWFEVSRDGGKLLYGSDRRIRVIAAGEKPPSDSGHPRKSGWIDLNRVKVSVDPHSEWEQMFREAWRLQRDQFWTGDMSEVDWHSVYQRYFPLIERVSTRSEFSDLMWEMQGELGTSHAYEFGGDYRRRPYYGQGFLGTDLTWDAKANGYRIGEFVVGDPWDTGSTSPLADRGLAVSPGDVIIAVNGQRLDQETGPAQLLVNQAGNEVLLTLMSDGADEAADERAEPHRMAELEDPVKPAQGSDTDRSANETDDIQADDQIRSITVRTIRSEAPARYRDWVEGNRAYVHTKSGGKVGYVHIPDMSARGYAEFHRGYLSEVDRDALIVDVRYNGGGHVSQLILEKLARRRIGYDWSRWGGIVPYPQESVAGPLVALTNEHAGSDGDIFCHSFKLMKLGPLIGKRTWGGVIGIFPRHSLVDGTITTQPEFSFWFDDVGWNVENYGTEPDIEVDITPQDYAAGRDPQLDRSIEEAMKLLAEHPVVKPDISTRPSRALPSLPPRR
jgi:tricorn protease